MSTMLWGNAVACDSKDVMRIRRAKRLQYIGTVKVLGVPPTLARKLIEEGLLAENNAITPNVQEDESYFQEKLEKIRAELSGAAKPIAVAEDTSTLLPVREAFHVYGCGEFSILEILNAVRRGKLPAYKEDGPFNLLNLRVCRRRLSELFITTVIGKNSGYVDFATAVVEFGLSKSKLMTILRHGSIEYISRSLGGRSHTFIQKATLKAFLAAHVELSDVEITLNKTGNALLRCLEGRQILPVWHRRHRDVGSWYRRSELKALDV